MGCSRSLLGLLEGTAAGKAFSWGKGDISHLHTWQNRGARGAELNFLGSQAGAGTALPARLSFVRCRLFWRWFAGRGARFHGRNLHNACQKAVSPLAWPSGGREEALLGRGAGAGCSFGAICNSERSLPGSFMPQCGFVLVPGELACHGGTPVSPCPAGRTRSRLGMGMTGMWHRRCNWMSRCCSRWTRQLLSALTPCWAPRRPRGTRR